MAIPVPKIAWVNRVDNAAAMLSASSQAGDLTITNVADPIIGKRWRTTSLTDVGFNHLGIVLGVLLTWGQWTRRSNCPS